MLGGRLAGFARPVRFVLDVAGIAALFAVFMHRFESSLASEVLSLLALLGILALLSLLNRCPIRLVHASLLELDDADDHLGGGTRFTCFTGTKVQVLTNLLALLVQKYKY